MTTKMVWKSGRVRATWLALVALVAASGFGNRAVAQSGPVEGSAQPPVEVVPQLVRYAGSLPGRAGDTVEMTFSIYPEAGNGAALWAETQQVRVGSDGKYGVLLGAATAGGLPQGVFAAGEGQWLGVAVEGGEEQARVKLASVAYAMKAADAELLAGRPVTEFVTQTRLTGQIAGQIASQLSAVAEGMAAEAARQFTAATAPALTGTGAPGYIPAWTGSATLGNSFLTQVGTGAATRLGIGTAAPASTLDLYGSATIRGEVAMEPTRVATASAGANSPAFYFGGNSYNSSTAASVPQRFALLTVATGNNTPHPSSSLELWFAAGANVPAATGLSVAPNGILTFANGQTFPGASGGSGTITGVAAGTGLTGGGTTGRVTLNVDPTQVPLLGAANTFAQDLTVNGNLKATNASFATMYATSTVQGGGVVSTGGIFGQGIVHMTPLTTATASNGGGASFLEASASTWNSSTNAVAPQNFFWGAFPVGNNTASPSGSLDFLYSNGGGGYNTTGLSINPTGIITFANGQTFPGGTGGSGTITGVTAGTGLTGGGTSGAVTVNVDTTKVPLLGSANSFTQSQTINGNETISGTLNAGATTLGPTAVNGSATISRGLTASSISANNPGGPGVFGGSSGTLSTIGKDNLGGGGTGQTGVWADAGPNTTGDPGIGLYATADNDWAGFFINNNGHSDQVPAIQAQNEGTGFALMAFTLGYGTSLFAQSDYPSGVSTGSLASYNASIWGDSGAMTGIIGSSDAYTGGSFFNSSDYHATVSATNFYSGGPGNGLAISAAEKGFGTVIRAEGNGGVCGMNTEGDVSCTGQVKSISTVDGARQVETYSVQSSENWFEDFGSAALEGGKATVAIEPAFAETVNTGAEYHVYLTPKGDSKGLYVTNEGPGSFEVHESGGGTSNIAFDYRIVAKRKGHETERLVDVTERFQAEKAAAAPPPAQRGQTGRRLQRIPGVRPGMRGASVSGKPQAH